MTSHRQVFRSSAIIGGASVVNMMIGVLKVKALAVLLGPMGIGLMGLYQNVMSVASTLAGCGVGTSGVRQLAATPDDPATLGIVRRALWTAHLFLGLFGMVLLWLFRAPLTQWVFGHLEHTAQVGWLGIGLLLTLIAGSQTALLQGLRRIEDLARVSILSAVVGAALGVLAVYLLGSDGVIWFVVVAPAANAFVASCYAARLPRLSSNVEIVAVRQQWLALLKLGVPLMCAGLIMLVTQLIGRSFVLRELGLDASGYFQAAWAISMIYVGFVLNAMAMDYYPRLSAAITNHETARQLVNEQV
ncbi:MAG: oligosaccharide flippase family protein, partial [Gammaproteobacteria bacterium]